MTMSQYPNNPIAERKAAVRKHSRAIQITGAVGLGAIVLGVVASATFDFYILVVLITLAVAGYNGWKIRGIINQVDEW